jgi:hypothetical protein
VAIPFEKSKSFLARKIPGQLNSGGKKGRGGMAAEQRPGQPLSQSQVKQNTGLLIGNL